MLKLLVNNKIATLSKNTSITLKIKNPAFNKEGAFSYPLKAPVEDNRATFGHADAEDNLQVQAPSFQLFMGNEPFMEGDIKLTETQGDYEFYLKAGKSAVANVLKESYLDEDINGQSWGDNPDGLTGLNNAVNGAYPDYLMVAPPVSTDDFICNEWDLTNQELISLISEDLTYFNLSMLVNAGRINPLVYLKPVIKQLFKGLGLIVNNNDFNLYNDFNRLCVFAPKKGLSGAAVLEKVANFLPHITAADLLNDLRARFNLVAFFNPFLGEVDYISFEKVFTSEIVDWTDKFIRSEQTPGKEEGAILLENEGDDNDTITYDQLDADKDLVSIADYDTMMAEVETDFNNNVNADKYYILSDSGRVFLAENNNGKGDLVNTYHIGSKESVYTYYNLITGSWPNTNWNFSQTLSAGVGLSFMLWRLPDDMVGRIERTLYIRNLGLYVASGSSIDITITLRYGSIDDWDNTVFVVITKTVTITNTDPYASPFNTHRGVAIDLPYSPELDETINGAQIVFTALSSIDATVGVRMGKQTDGLGSDMHSYASIDGYDRRVTELGRIANYNKGDGDEPETFSPKNKTLLNDFVRMQDYLFQMPVSDISPKQQQSNYAFTFYRGLIDSEIDGSQTAPFANFDDVDINMADYYNRLTNGADPDMTLRWHNDNGIVSKFWQKTINWILYYRRPVRKVFELSVNDLVNFKMWQRVRVDNKLYLVDTIDIKANADGTLSNATVDMYTL
nr:hypothetical protein [uncultured Carboxylicivirga sp.]